MNEDAAVVVERKVTEGRGEGMLMGDTFAGYVGGGHGFMRVKLKFATSGRQLCDGSRTAASTGSWERFIAAAVAVFCTV